MIKKRNKKINDHSQIKNVDILHKRTGGWTQALVTLVFILIPAIIMWVFLSTDFSNKHLLNTKELWGVAIGFVVYALLITIFLIWIQLIWIDTMNFTLPISIILMAILLSQNLHTWVRALIAIGLIFTALPINMLTVRIIENRFQKINIKNKYKK